MQWPFFISSLILGFGWIMMYGPAGFVSVKVQQVLGGVPWNLYSLPGMALTEAVALAPIAYMFCANALRQSDASLESAAQVCGAGPLRIIVQVIFPCCGHRSSTARSWSSRCRSRLSAFRCYTGSRSASGVLDIPLHERPAVDQPGLQRARRRVSHHPGRHDRPGRRFRPSCSRTRSGSSRCGARPPDRAPRAGLAEVGQLVRHHLLRRDGRSGPDRRPDIALVHAGLHARCSSPFEVFDDEQLREGVHIRGRTCSRS